MQSRDRMTAIALTVLVWGLAGAVFGALFIALYQVLALLGLDAWQTLIIASVAAAMTTVAFYSSMQVAMVGSTSGVVASIGYLIVAPQGIDLPTIATVAAVLGAVNGLFFTWIIRRTARPLAETLTGLLAGLGAGVILSAVLTFYPGDLSAFVLAAGVVALVGSLFQLNEHWIVQVCSRWLPAGLAAPIVSALIAAVVAAGIWMMSGTTAAVMDLATKAVIDGVINDVPRGFTGGMLGGAITGLVLELLGFHVEEHEGL
jgi:hypothetical protein